jgi:hypothetical protein
MFALLVFCPEIPQAAFQVQGSKSPSYSQAAARPPSTLLEPSGPRGIKRSLKESLTPEAASADTAQTFNETSAPQAKRRRTSWWDGSSLARAASPAALFATAGRVATAIAAAVRGWKPPWRAAASAPASAAGVRMGSGRKGWVVVRFKDDGDKPAAVRRQIAFYFSDSNLPNGASRSLPALRRSPPPRGSSTAGTGRACGAGNAGAVSAR